MDRPAGIESGVTRSSVIGSDRSASVRAGMLAGVVGLATFLVIHHVWIIPIWFIAPVGTVVATVGGAAVGAAYAELRPHLPTRPWAAPALMVVVGVLLLPSVVIAELREPIFAMGPDGSGALLVPGPEAAADVIGGLLIATTAVGAGLGWVITRSTRAAMTLACAALALAVGPGHNIPLLGGTVAVAKELVILASVCAVSSVTLVEGQAWLARSRTG